MTINYAIADTEAEILARATSIEARRQALLLDGRSHGDFWGDDAEAEFQAFFMQLGRNLQAI